MAVRGQRGRRWPSAEVVALVHVGAAVGVDADRQKSAVDNFHHFRVGVRSRVHGRALLGPGRHQRQQDRLACGRSLAECTLGPLTPVDGARQETNYNVL